MLIPFQSSTDGGNQLSLLPRALCAAGGHSLHRTQHTHQLSLTAWCPWQGSLLQPVSSPLRHLCNNRRQPLPAARPRNSYLNSCLLTASPSPGAVRAGGAHPATPPPESPLLQLSKSNARMWFGHHFYHQPSAFHAQNSCWKLPPTAFLPSFLHMGT